MDFLINPHNNLVSGKFFYHYSHFIDKLTENLCHMPMVIKIITDGIDIQTQTVWFGGHILFSPVFTYTKVESAHVLIMQLQE